MGDYQIKKEIFDALITEISNNNDRLLKEKGVTSI